MIQDSFPTGNCDLRFPRIDLKEKKGVYYFVGQKFIDGIPADITLRFIDFDEKVWMAYCLGQRIADIFVPIIPCVVNNRKGFLYPVFNSVVRDMFLEQKTRFGKVKVMRYIGRLIKKRRIDFERFCIVSFVLGADLRKMRMSDIVDMGRIRFNPICIEPFSELYRNFIHEKFFSGSKNIKVS